MSNEVMKLRELVVFEKLHEDPVISKFFDLLIHANNNNVPEGVIREKYAAFAAALYGCHREDWSTYFKEKVLSLDTCCVYFASKDHEIPRLMLDAAMNELALLSKVGAITPEYFFDDPYMAKWFAYDMDLQADYLNRLMHISQYGFGEFAQYTMFRIEEDPNGYYIRPVTHPDPVTFNDLFGYHTQHQIVLDNTEVLLAGYRASNILLYGDAGTGKSATVKAAVNQLSDKGLRLIEISKNQLRYLPELMDTLSVNPLKFIIFIDDLSFQENDDDFAALKAVLEGSASARSKNTVIYATSNRRHIVRETFSERNGDDVHKNDTMQETVSLSERFGIKVLFEKPTSMQYYEIVRGLAAQYKIDMPADQLKTRAEQFALRKSGRSARAARQFIEQLAAESRRLNADFR